MNDQSKTNSKTDFPTNPATNSTAGIKTNTKARSLSLVTTAMLLALAFVTSFIKLWAMPMGGSVTLLSMFFVTYIGYLYGPVYGLAGGFVFGLLQFIADPYILSIPQVIVDYVFAFTALGISGFFHKSKHGLQLGYLAGITGRFIFSTLSGVIFFGTYGNEYGLSAFMYSFLYNALYIYAEGIVTLILISIPVLNNQLRTRKALHLQ